MKKTRCPSEIDALLGWNIRQRRIEMKFSQTSLGEAVGVTFQQIQKYELGRNRLTVGRLLQIAEALDIRPELLWRTDLKLSTSSGG